ncbi:MAG: HNH endonuclease [Elusimicrobia bacterium]|nr:HNH endonuclease [Elusimicrobiota bacterium]
MNEMIKKCAESDDEALTRELKFVVDRERRNLVTVLIVLGEYGWRRLYREEGYYSLFEYCMRVLKFDESAAYRHITAARVLRQYPLALPLIESGDLTLTSLLILSPVLTPENHTQMFMRARGKTRRELETIIAGNNPLPARMDTIRSLPVPPPSLGVAPIPPTADSAPPPPQSDACALPAPREWQAVMPISLDRVRIGFDAAVELMRLIYRAKQLLRHKYPEGRIEDVLHDALTIFLDRKDPQRKLGLKSDAKSTETPRAPRFLQSLKNGRYIPAWVKSAVWERDDGRCAWRFDDGTVCGSKDWIEYDHIKPYARGGRSDTPRNVRLLCRLHNGLAAAAAGLSAGRALSSGTSDGAGFRGASGSPT